MIKKISAIVLALVLCLSVIVVPASAAGVNLPADKKMAFSLEWDKASYSAGDTAILSVYMDAADDVPLFTGAFTIGLNSAVISQVDNPIADVKANATTNDPFGTYWKPAATNLSWLAAAIVTKVNAQNTSEENALYDHYLKFTAAKNIAGSHENAGNNMDGFYGSDFDPSQPIMTIALKVRADVADGTALNAAITTGTYKVTPAAASPTTWKYYTAPGSASTSANLTAADFDVSQAVATATVGEVAAPSILKPMSSQIRFKGVKTEADFDAYNALVGEEKTFDVRTRATISTDDFNAKFTDEATAKTGITDFGFVYAAQSNVAAFDLATAKGVAQGTAAEGYVKHPCHYIQRTAEGYNFTCLISGIADAEHTEVVNCVAYVCFNGEYIFFDAPATADYNALYTAHHK